MLLPRRLYHHTESGHVFYPFTQKTTYTVTPNVIIHNETKSDHVPTDLPYEHSTIFSYRLRNERIRFKDDIIVVIIVYVYNTVLYNSTSQTRITSTSPSLAACYIKINYKI